MERAFINYTLPGGEGTQVSFALLYQDQYAQFQILPLFLRGKPSPSEDMLH